MPPEVPVLVTADDDGPGPVPGAEVTFLPRAEDDGAGVYPGGVPALIRELEAAGTTARTWHPADECEFLGDRGPITEILLDFAVGIASSGGWFALEGLLRRRRGRRVKISVILETDGARRRIEASGDGEQVARALAELKPFGLPPDSSQPGLPPPGSDLPG